MLFCKNCGGKLELNASSEEIVCQSCGKSQTIQCIVNGTADPLYVESEAVGRAINTYRRAMNMYTQGENVRTLDTAAQMFKCIPEVLNATDMVQACQQKSELVAKANSYRQAIEDMHSEDSQRIRTAVETLHLLADYKDAAQKETEAQSLLETVLQKEQEKEAARKRTKKIKQLTVAAVLAAVVLVVVISLVVKTVRYDSGNLALSLSPCDDYLITKGNRYVFCYAVEMENTGSVDIEAFCADVVIEDEDGRTLVDTQMQASDATALVRKGKSREMIWELSVTDENVAQALYEDFSDLKVSITVTQIDFADGKEKIYE